MRSKTVLTLRWASPVLVLLAGFALGAALVLPTLVQSAEEEVHPIYVGAEVCASCHRGKTMGHQHSLWLMSKHARAYAILSKPEAKDIARLSGIPQESQESPMCLGCHATGAHVEEWEKDPTFHVEDGVQCEKCHGPGGEHVHAWTTGDREAAERTKLAMPAIRDCMGCHEVKGSHVAVHSLPKMDMEKAWDTIAHPTPKPWMTGEPPLLPKPKDASGLKHTGVMACAACHKAPMLGYQFSKWQMSKHARAYAALATPKAHDIAKEMDVRGNPWESPDCLQCHTTAHHNPAGGFLEGFAISEGVGCEACHGPGSQYSHEAVMRDERSAKLAGLLEVTRETCLACHEDAHGKPFDYEKALAEIAHPTEPPKVVEDAHYKTPLSMALRPDGKELYVACEASHTVVVVDAIARRKVAEIPAGGHPTDVTFSPDGTRAYVTNRLDDSVSVINVAARKVIETIPVGDEPHGVLTDASGRHLYVLNTSSDSISVIDTESLEEVRRLAASRSPWSLSRSPDGSRLAVTNTLPRFRPSRSSPTSEVAFIEELRSSPVSEVTLVDMERGVIEDRVVVPDANMLQGIDWDPGGEFALITLMHNKTNVPMTRLLQGWTITNGLGILWSDGRVDQVLLDEPHLCFPDPADVAITPDGKLALVSSSGSDRVAVVDLAQLISMLRSATEHERKHVLPYHVGKPTEFIVKHIETRNSPRGILITPDGGTAFVANALDDSLTVIDVAKLEAVGRIDLGGSKEITTVRYGERLFHVADITFRRQFSCHSCHPDGHVNGLTYDIEPDGIGSSPVDNRTLRGILDTAPFKWEGTNPSLARQCGPRLAVFFTRIQPFTPEELYALDRYICTIPRPPNRYRPLGAELTDAQRRGKAVFERTRANDGRVIHKENRCITCHFPPLFTDRSRRNVGAKMPLDIESEFDVPHLNNIYDSSPYLHNGIADTLEEIWTKYNPDDQHGVTNDMTKDQLNDLIEYIKTL